MLLIENGADPNKQDSSGRTPLMMAARGDDPLELVQAFVNAGKVDLAITVEVLVGHFVKITPFLS